MDIILKSVFFINVQNCMHTTIDIGELSQILFKNKIKMKIKNKNMKKQPLKYAY